ncbi:alcohol dehydrogenase catalytic domain-containing protein [Streptosporangium canum]|uniref:alcohol dehydrogenase catalytic domain-containing protein n=1 Tax=Streptosporangium canum TaxID=324952 RepID=UPI003416F454
MTDTMRAVVLNGPGPVENLVITDRPIPATRPGWVRIAVKAFGLNRSELHTRLGLAEGVTFPRVPGIEAVGIIDSLDPGDEDSGLLPGQQAATTIGGRPLRDRADGPGVDPRRVRSGYRRTRPGAVSAAGQEGGSSCRSSGMGCCSLNCGNSAFVSLTAVTESLRVPRSRPDGENGS